MWSKPVDAYNKNMTVKNKTQKKRANGNAVTSVEVEPEEKKNGNAAKQPSKSNKNKGRNRAKKEAKNLQNGTAKQESKIKEKISEVVLRNVGAIDGSNKRNDSTVKRYSDSYVIENSCEGDSGKKEDITPAPPSRTLSGFFTVDHSKKVPRKLSDIFRSSGDKDVQANNKKNERKPSLTVTPASPTDFRSSSTSLMEPPNSYLQRVKSKIYKSKSDDTAKIELDKYRKIKSKKSLDLSGRIPEEDMVMTTDNPKSFTPFRLMRQSTNLERVSQRFGSRKSVETTAVPIEKPPVLVKAKSSSAINLNLLRTRRNKIMEESFGARSAASSVCKDEFDYIAFGNVHSSRVADPVPNLVKYPSWLHIRGDSKDSQLSSQADLPLETDHDKSQDHSEGSANHDNLNASVDKHAETGSKSAANLPTSGSKKKITGNINRSESVKEQSEKRKQRRNISDPSQNTSGSVDLDRQHGWTQNSGSGASSNSNISCNGKLSESPSNSNERVQQGVVQSIDSDSDIEREGELPNWHELISEEQLNKLNPSEKKRQDVINELFHTEVSHVQVLKVLYKLFYKKLHESQILKQDELNLIFPNIKELLDIHLELERDIKRIRRQDPLVKQIGDVLLNTFSGPRGQTLQNAAAVFCERQQLALEFITKRRERDSKFDNFLSESEKKRQCRRLQLQGIIPAEMQRLVRYPLLLERLVKSVEAANADSDEYTEELSKLQSVHAYSKDILNHVNEAAKAAHNRHRLEDIQRHLDISSFKATDHNITNEFRNIDLTRYHLVLEGIMQLRRTNKTPVPVHVLLLEEMVVILHRENERFLLKFFQSGTATQPQPFSPIIKMNTLLVRTNAACKLSLFLVTTSTNNSQMYEMVTEDEVKRETWFKHISDAIEAYNKREGKISRISNTPSVPGILEDDLDVLLHLPSGASDHDKGSTSTEEPKADTPAQTENEDAIDLKMETSKIQSDNTDNSTDCHYDLVSGGGIQLATKVSVEDWPLIQPSQVRISVPPVCTAEPMLTPLEQIRQKDALVKQALSDKEDLVADLLSIPREHFQHIADLTSTTTPVAPDDAASNVVDRLVASIFQVNILQKAVNEAYNIPDLEALTAQEGKQPSETTVPSIPASLVKEITDSLSSQLTNLLNDFKQVEEDKEKLRQECSKVNGNDSSCDERTESEFFEAISDDQN